MVDFFSISNQLVVKTHPSDTDVNYKDVFSDSIVIPREMPSELLPYCSSSRFNSIITAYSTSIHGLKKLANEVISFDFDCYKYYDKFVKYFNVSKIIKKVYSSKYKIYGLNINSYILNQFLKNDGIKSSIKDIQKEKVISLKEKVILCIDNIDDIYLLNKIINGNNNIVVIILDENINNLCGLNWNYLRYGIIKNNLLKKKYSELIPRSEYLFIYSENIPLLTKVEDIYVSKKLKYSYNEFEFMMLSKDFNYYIEKLLSLNSDIFNENEKLKNELMIIKNSGSYKLLSVYWNLKNKFFGFRKGK